MRLAMATATSIFLMVADVRLQFGTWVRSTVAVTLSPFQWLSSQPVKAVNLLGDYVVTVESAQQTKEEATLQMAQLALKAQRTELLERENTTLRRLLELQQQLPIKARAAQVKYIATDPFNHTLVLDKGSVHKVVRGAPVIDGHGLIGQVIRVYPHSSEVRLLTNPQQVVPVINHRTGKRNLVYGTAKDTPQGSLLEMRFLPLTDDVKQGDVIATSGTGGVYPAGLPVGVVTKVEKYNRNNFLYVQLNPAGKFNTVSHVLIIDPQTSNLSQQKPTTITPKEKEAS